MTEIADRYRRIAGTFTQRVSEVPADAWDNQSPVPEWATRDVVRHLVDWVPPMLSSGSDLVFPTDRRSMRIRSGPGPR